jgi:hypothetical protein
MAGIGKWLPSASERGTAHKLDRMRRSILRELGK